MPVALGTGSADLRRHRRPGFAYVVSGLLTAHHRLQFAAVRAVFPLSDFPPSPIVRIMASLIAIRLSRPRAIDVMSLRIAGSV